MRSLIQDVITQASGIENPEVSILYLKQNINEFKRIIEDINLFIDIEDIDIVVHPSYNLARFLLSHKMINPKSLPDRDTQKAIVLSLKKRLESACKKLKLERKKITFSYNLKCAEEREKYPGDTRLEFNLPEEKLMRLIETLQTENILEKNLTKEIILTHFKGSDTTFIHDQKKYQNHRIKVLADSTVFSMIINLLIEFKVMICSQNTKYTEVCKHLMSKNNKPFNNLKGAYNSVKHNAAVYKRCMAILIPFVDNNRQE